MALQKVMTSLLFAVPFNSIFSFPMFFLLVLPFLYYRRPPCISACACRDNRRDVALKVEMRLLLTSKNRTRPLNNYVMTVFDQSARC